MKTFQELGLGQSVLEALNKMGFEEPTPIQAKTIPPAMEGQDVIGQSQTGTGKTTAFGVPLVEKCSAGSPQIQGIVISPTRELAVQVAEELNKIGQIKGIRALPIYGGQDIKRQFKSLQKKPHIIVATPGRLIDHLRRKTIRLDQIKIVVLDEADEMLNMGFIEDIEAILKEIPSQRQTLLFSATMPAPIRRLAQRFMVAPEEIGVRAKEVTVPSIEQRFVEVQERKKFDALTRLLDSQSPDLAIIFCRTKRRVDELAEALNKRGYSAEAIHGDLSQPRRDTVMGQFRDGAIDVLVATDVAARGLDVMGVTHVYNFDIPQDPEGYVHRIGRTGRVGRQGLAVTFVTPREMGQLKVIESMTGRRISRIAVPTMDEAIEGQQRLAMERLLQAATADDVQRYRRLAEELLEEADSVTLLSAALKMLTKEPDQTPVHLTVEPSQWEKPRRGKPGRGRQKPDDWMYGKRTPKGRGKARSGSRASRG